MPPEVPEPVGPRDWLQRARSNLVRARQPKPDEVLWEDLCFDAQQAAEKSLKAVLLDNGIPFPPVHSIGALLTLLSKHAVAVPAFLEAATQLTDYAVTTRYPGLPEPVTEEDFQAALASAEAVYQWAFSVIAAR